ncbi:39S ribosomal protein L47, mitochondrial, partial [Pseudolycoriella hygida]
MLCGKMMSLQTKPLACKSFLSKSCAQPQFQLSSKIHTTIPRLDIMEFFDDSKNWGQQEVKHGRAWTLDELRIKSNVDLHKLWFILLKERNMLLTMEHESNKEVRLFPSPERIDKVKISMRHLETVVRERNRAYHLLETGLDGERPARLVNNQLGMRHMYRATEHVIPKMHNKKWKQNHVFRYSGSAVRKFRKLYREKLYNEKRKAKNRDRNHVKHLMRRFPHLSKDLLAKKYPHVDIAKIIRNDESRGHHTPE